MTPMIPYVSRLTIFPIKALDGLTVEHSMLLESGALQGDREFAIFDEADRFVNGKRNPHVHSLRAQYDLRAGTVSLHKHGTEFATSFHLTNEWDALETWLSQYFGFPVQVKQNLKMGFPDDTVSPGPTIVSTATLEAIASWYPELTVDEIRRRFRTNIEISGVLAFWEDRLFSTPDSPVTFQIGDATFMGVNPSQRCVVITRDSQTGDAYPTFQKTFITRRRETLPSWSERSQFNHFYRLAVNTRVPSSEAGTVIKVGDPVRL
ncbi:MAG: MOSC domain-containing protein [Elainellaceae cyanobacterium]